VPARRLELILIACLFIGLTACTKTPPSNGPLTGKELLNSVLTADMQQILLHPDEVEIFTIHPDPNNKDEVLYKVIDRFHGYGVLGQATLEDKVTCELLGSSLVNAIKQGRDDGVLCFEPRHAIRAKRGWSSVDVVVCFHCRNAYVFDSERKSDVVVDIKALASWKRVFAEHKLPLYPERS
jgi:hypothetical protein